MSPPRIYNVFPRLLGPLDRWLEHAGRAAAMGFDWLYVNPFQYPGFSGSIYAVKDYHRVDPLLLPEQHPDHHYDDAVVGDGGLGLLGETLERVRALGLKPLADLVINHTARDAPLVEQHPEWYVRDADGAIVSPQAIDPADSRQVTVWGDLAELQHTGEHAGALGDYLAGIVRRYTALGFAGFRCDAAYKVPAALWQQLIAAARSVDPEATFFGETLGARLDEVEALRDAGLHYIFNSSKWWDFEASWCIDQMHDNADIAPSVSFPESHDTPRLFADSGGSEIEQKRRYAFAAGFSTGVLMPIGYEFGFERRLDVVHTRPDDWEAARIDLSDFVRRVNAMKCAHAGLGTDAVALAAPANDDANGDGGRGLLIDKRLDGSVAWLAVNRALDAAIELPLPEAARGLRILRPFDGNGSSALSGGVLALAAGEVAYLVEA